MKKKLLILGLTIVALFGVYFSVGQYFQKQQKTSQELNMSLLQEPLENTIVENQMPASWTLYRSSDKNISFQYLSSFEGVREDNDEIVVSWMDLDPFSKPTAGVWIYAHENPLSLSPGSWWWLRLVKNWQWKEWRDTTHYGKSIDGTSRFIVASSESWEKEPFLATYLPCGERMCEVRMRVIKDYPLEDTYRRVLTTLDEWKNQKTGLQIDKWEGKYENTLAGYRVKYPLNFSDNRVVAPERDLHEAGSEDRYVRLPYQSAAYIRSLFCTQLGDGKAESGIDSYLSYLPGASILERWSIPVESGTWVGAARVTGGGAVRGLQTYTGDEGDEGYYAETVYVKRDGLIIALSFSATPSTRRDLFHGVVDSLELLPLPSLKEKTGEEACKMNEMSDGYWKNNYVVMHPKSLQNLGEQARLQGVYPEAFEILGGGWARQTIDKWVFCKGDRVYVNYDSFRVTDEKRGLAEDEYSEYKCEEEKITGEV